MKNKFLYLFLFLILTFNSKGQINPKDTLDQYILRQMNYFGTPGLELAIVQDGNIRYVKGFGTRTTGKNEPVDNNTLFAIGSISKSFTAVSLAMLVNEGKINWDDKVVKYVPYFELYDPYVTHSFTIRDLLTHRSGLKQQSGGTLFYHSDFNIEQIIRRLKYLDKFTEFRTKPAYQNVTFMVAGKVVEAVSGISWEEFVRQRIFKPLGMNNSVVSHSEMQKSRNIASAHIKNENFKLIPIEQENLDNVAPAGAIHSTAKDMAHYMNFILNNGVVNQDTLIAPEVFNELIKPQFHYQLYPKPVHNEFTSYGFGWWLTPKSGNKIVEHSGGVDGSSANLVMVQNKKFGIIVLANTGDGSSVTFSTTYDVIGNFLKDQDYKGFSNMIRSLYPKRDSLKIAARNLLMASRKKNTTPSLSLEKYTGTYNDKMYGDIYITKQGNDMYLEFSHTPLFKGKLSHWHYDTFKVDWLDPRVTSGFITFSFNAKGEITGFKIDQPNLLDVDFSELEITRKETDNKE